MAQTMWFAAAYRWGHEGKRATRWYGDSRDLWIRRRTLAYIPLLLVLWGCWRILTGWELDSDKLLRLFFTGPNLVLFGIMFMAYELGMWARMAQFVRRDFLRDVLYGPTRWLIVAAIADMALGIDALTNTLPLLGVIVFSCVMAAWFREPMFMTRRGVAAWAQAAR